MERKFIVSDPERCTGCRICELVCSGVNEKAFNPLFSRIRMIQVKPFARKAIACHFCEHPKCVKSCPRKALKIDEKTGVILVNEERCNGCGWCMKTCEFGAIFVHKDRKSAVMCNLCQHNPKCVEFCPKEALQLVGDEELVDTEMPRAQKTEKRDRQVTNERTKTYKDDVQEAMGK